MIQGSLMRISSESAGRSKVCKSHVRIETNVKGLDERVAKIVRTWLEAMAEPPT